MFTYMYVCVCGGGAPHILANALTNVNLTVKSCHFTFSLLVSPAQQISDFVLLVLSGVSCGV